MPSLRRWQSNMESPLCIYSVPTPGEKLRRKVILIFGSTAAAWRICFLRVGCMLIWKNGLISPSIC